MKAGAAKKHRKQYAALPFRWREGQAEILLITSRDTGRWIIPKGWPVSGVSAAGSAAREAYEEAGVVGAVSRKRVGRYRYEKRLTARTSVQCTVDVFPIMVESEEEDWPERTQRTKQWVKPAEAALLVSDPGLPQIIRKTFKSAMAAG